MNVTLADRFFCFASSRSGKTCGWGLRAGLSTVFIYAGGTKIKAFDDFAEQIAGFQIIDGRLAILVAFYLPWLEIIGGIALLLSRFFRGAVAILGGLLLVFIFALASADFREIDVTCGCFGADSEAGTHLWVAIARNFGLLAALAAVTLLHRHRFNRSRAERC